jgi:hypothetical protein
MDKTALAHFETRLRRLERQNRMLIGLLCLVTVVASVAATHAAPNVITASEVRAQRFTLIDPRGGIADDWYITDPSDTNVTRNLGGPPYSGWWYHSP